MSQFDYQAFYRRNLPHIQPYGSTFFVTFRLEGSIPRGVIRQWNRERQWLAHVAQINANHYEEVKSEFEIRDDKEWQRIMAYVLNNPLKAGYVKRWQDWKWNYRRV